MSKIKILMPASEVFPLAKVGGLADVVGSLPIALNELNLDVRIIAPLYQTIDRQKFKLEKIISNVVVSFINNETINIWRTTLPNSDTIIYLIENETYFSGDVYYGDNNEKFLFFSFACLYALSFIDFMPDIIHCHDYQTAMIPFLIKHVEKFNILQNIKTVLTIHNLAYQGSISNEILRKISINTDRAEDVNYLEQGINLADAFTTVSPTYANEIKTIEFGANLENVIIKNENKLLGIINGIDYNFFNPATDKLITQNFDFKNLDKKIINKKAVQEKFNLPTDNSIPLVGLISRIVEQKGFDLFNDEFSQLNCQFVFLGTGNQACQDIISALTQKYPNKFAVNFSFDEKLAHQIYAGCDIFAMPSRFEPCGLGQMIAMRYGTIPVVKKLGGLADTVNNQNGFTFELHSNQAFYQALENTINTYINNPEKWRVLQINSMNSDFSWSVPAKEYQNIYQKISK